MSPATDAQIEQEMARHERDFRWVMRNYDELVADYPDQHVAVRDEEIIASANSIEDLVEILNIELGMSPNEVLIEFLYAEDPNFILA